MVIRLGSAPPAITTERLDSPKQAACQRETRKKCRALLGFELGCGARNRTRSVAHSLERGPQCRGERNCARAFLQLSAWARNSVLNQEGIGDSRAVCRRESRRNTNE